jgi:hypothetical protein
MNRGEQPQAVPERTDPRRTGEVGAQSSLIGPASESSGFSPRSSNGLGRSVELHIEELVLHGFAPGDRYLIGEAVERELTRLFSEQGTPQLIAEGGEMVGLNAGSFEVEQSSKPETLGIQLANALYRGMT